MAYEVPEAVLADIRRTAKDRLEGTDAYVWPLLLARGPAGKRHNLDAVGVGVLEGKLPGKINKRIFLTAFIEEGRINFCLDEAVGNKRRVVSIGLGAEYKEDLLEQLDLVACEL